MSDGISEGYRMAEEADREEVRLRKYGAELCFLCGKENGEAKMSDEYTSEKYPCFRLLLRGGMSPAVIKEVRFCGPPCMIIYGVSEKAVKEIEELLGNDEVAPAARINVRRMLGAVLNKTRYPSV